MQHLLYSDDSDEKLCILVASGNRIAEETLVERYTRLVRIYARPFFLAGGDAEDLIQEGMLGLLAAVRGYDPTQQASFKTFAETCVRNRLFSAVRSDQSGKHTPLNESVSFEAPQLDAEFAPSFLNLSAQSPEELFIRQEHDSEVLRALHQSLSTFEKKVLSLYLEGYSYTEIGEKLERNSKAVDNAVQRIRRKLQHHFH